MKKATYKKIGEQIVKERIIVPAEYDELGNLITEEHEAEVEVVKAVMGVVYEDLTPEEVEALENDEPITPPTTEERLEAMEAALLEMVLGGM